MDGQDIRQNPNINGTRKQNQKKLNTASVNITSLSYLDPSQIPCDEELSIAIDVCTKPFVDLIEGSLLVWPKTKNDAADLCQSVSF